MQQIIHDEILFIAKYSIFYNQTIYVTKKYIISRKKCYPFAIGILSPNLKDINHGVISSSIHQQLINSNTYFLVSFI